MNKPFWLGVWTGMCISVVIGAIAIALMGCGGAPFTFDANASALDAGNLATDKDSASFDATGSPVWQRDSASFDVENKDSESSQDSDAPTSGDSSAPLQDSATAPEACTDQPPKAWPCPTTAMANLPDQTCLATNNKAGDTDSIVNTPSACATWCTYTCECLLKNFVCTTGTVTCIQFSDHLELSCNG